MGNWYESTEVSFLREQLMLRELWFDVGADLWVRFQKGKYAFVRFCNRMCLCITFSSQRCINNPFHCICMYVYRVNFVYLHVYGVYVCAYLYVHLCMGIYVCAYMYMHLCVCVCVYSRMHGFMVQVQYRLKQDIQPETAVPITSNDKRNFNVLEIQN